MILLVTVQHHYKPMVYKLILDIVLMDPIIKTVPDYLQV